MMKIDISKDGQDVISIDITDGFVMPRKDELSVVPLVCGIAIGIVIPIGLVAAMTKLLSIEFYTSSPFGIGIRISPAWIIVLAAVLAFFVWGIWLLYVLWKKWQMEMVCKNWKNIGSMLSCILENADGARLIQFVKPDNNVGADDHAQTVKTAKDVKVTNAVNQHGLSSII